MLGGASERDLDLAKLQKLRDDGTLSESEWIRAKHPALNPDEPVGNAQRAHADRIEYANSLYTEGRYTADQYAEFRRVSEAELQRDLKAVIPTRRWDAWRIVNFRSRNLRAEFWAAWGVGALIFWGGGIYFALAAPEALDFVVYPLFCVWFLVLLGATVNRLHDMGQPGWFSLALPVPLVGLLLFFWVGTEKGQDGANKWGLPIP